MLSRASSSPTALPASRCALPCLASPPSTLARPTLLFTAIPPSCQGKMGRALLSNLNADRSSPGEGSVGPGCLHPRHPRCRCRRPIRAGCPGGRVPRRVQVCRGGGSGPAPPRTRGRSPSAAVPGRPQGFVASICSPMHLSPSSSSSSHSLMLFPSHVHLSYQGL